MICISERSLEYTIRQALCEDAGKRDITTDLVIPRGKVAEAVLLAGEDFIVCGTAIAAKVFKTRDQKIGFKPFVKDGWRVRRGAIIAKIKGRVASILGAERVALNFLSLLSGIATKTRGYVDAVRPYKVKILDTRKTIPGLRALEKYAVRVGGGHNHRMSLDEMVLIKDNHLAASCLPFRQAPCVKEIIEAVKNKKPENVKIEIEVKNLKEFKDAIRAKPDIIMLDNMKPSDIKKAVMIKRHTPYAVRHTLIEASGGITLRNIKKIAACGPDFISVGALTHSVDSVDISLEIQ